MNILTWKEGIGTDKMVEGEGRETEMTVVIVIAVVKEAEGAEVTEVIEAAEATVTVVAMEEAAEIEMAEGSSTVMTISPRLQQKSLNCSGNDLIIRKM